MRPAALAVLLALAAATGAAAEEWEVDGGTLTYTVTHALHVVHGVSHGVRGGARCERTCSVLAAAAVDSFASGDSNRDLHMLQVARGAAHPVVAVQVGAFPLPGDGDGQVRADLDVSFAGGRRVYKDVSVRLERVEGRLRVRGVVPLRLTDLGIERPAFLGVPVKDECPVEFDVRWRRKTAGLERAP